MSKGVIADVEYRAGKNSGESKLNYEMTGLSDSGLPDVRRGPRLGRIGPDCIRQLLGSAGAVVERPGRSPANLAIREVIRDTVVDGPVPELAEQILKLHRQYYAGRLT